MSTRAAVESARRLADLRARLQAQRGRVGALLGPVDGRGDGFPRSATLRLLIHRPELVAKVLGLALRLFRSR